MKSMKIEKRRQGDVPVIEVSGEVDHEDAPAFRDQIDRAIGPVDTRVVLDAHGLTFLTSPALGHLMGIVLGMRKRGGEIVLARPGKFLRRTLSLLMMDRQLRMFESVEDAVAALGKTPGA